MRNDYIGTSIDGDARANCPCQVNGANTINTVGCGCENNRQPRYNCGCGNTRQIRHNDCDKCENNNRSERGNGCSDCKDNNWQTHCKGCGNPCDCEDNNRQTRGKGCDDCDNDYSRHGRSGGKGCSCNGQTPAMVYAQHHDLDNMYCSEKALLRGTLFGCLDKPMCHERCADNACSTQCQEDKFAIWELRLYLNTHPCDQQALALLRKLTAQMDEDCGCCFMPECDRWSWLDGPWPWEYQRCCGKEA